MLSEAFDMLQQAYGFGEEYLSRLWSLGLLELLECKFSVFSGLISF